MLKDNTPTASENSRTLIGGAFNLTDYLNQPASDKNHISSTDTVDQIEAAKTEYRVYAEKADDTEDYIVDQTSHTYLLDKDGKFLNYFNHTKAPKKLPRLFDNLTVTFDGKIIQERAQC